MSTASARQPGIWVSILSLFLCLDLASGQTATYKFVNTPTSFEGFYIANPTSVATDNCKSTAAWSTSSTYGHCCGNGNICTYYTACTSGTLIPQAGRGWSPYTCTSDTHCATITVFPTFPYLIASTSWKHLACAQTTYSVFTLFREVYPATAAVTRTLTADGTTVTVTPSSDRITATAAEPTSEPSAFDIPGDPHISEPDDLPGNAGGASVPDTGASAAASAPSSPSKAWIAGAVVGPVVVLAALGVLALWLVKRRRKEDVGAVGGGAVGGGGGDAGGGAQPMQQQPYPQGGQQQYAAAGQQPYAAAGQQQPAPADHQQYAAGGQPSPMYSPTYSGTPSSYEPLKPELPGHYPEGTGGYPQPGYFPSQSPPPQELGPGWMQRQPQELGG
ncbi:hypothetical protein QBC39DRAFT_411272 [Podospora conica]|nr:hypothetical protein QBC39DRAFT_411272 [Schizothecium conicum]